MKTISTIIFFSVFLQSISLKVKQADSVKFRADKFIDQVLKSDSVRWTFVKSKANWPEYVGEFIGNFEQKGLDTVFAYSNRKYPKKTKPYRYEHFVLFLIKYKSQDHAKSAFDRFTKDTEVKDINEEKLDTELYNRLMRIYVISKYGGLIGQKGNYILSLVETCGDNNLKLSWKKYEQLFIESIFDDSDKGEIILNADCGMMRFEKETIE